MLWIDFDLQHKYTLVHIVQHNITKQKKTTADILLVLFQPHSHWTNGTKMKQLNISQFYRCQGKIQKSNQHNIVCQKICAGFLIFFHSSTVFDNVGSFYKLCILIDIRLIWLQSDKTLWRLAGSLLCAVDKLFRNKCE